MAAENAAAFIRENLYDSDTEELCRSWREGKGPRGVAEDYAFLTQGIHLAHCCTIFTEVRLRRLAGSV